MTQGETGIGTLNEGSLHRQIKSLLCQPGDLTEVALDGFVIDICRAGELIEIQTGSFTAMRRKLDSLLDRYPIRVVHPLAAVSYLQRDLVSESTKQNPAQGRRSPKKRSVYDALDQLVSFPTLLDHPNFVLEILLVSVDVMQSYDPSLRRRRGGWRVHDRRLREVLESHTLTCARDLFLWLPSGLGEVFSTSDIAAEGLLNRAQAQKLTYCLRSLGWIELVGRDKNGFRYRRANPSDLGEFA